MGQLASFALACECRGRSLLQLPTMALLAAGLPACPPACVTSLDPGGGNSSLGVRHGMGPRAAPMCGPSRTLWAKFERQHRDRFFMLPTNGEAKQTDCDSICFGPPEVGKKRSILGCDLARINCVFAFVVASPNSLILGDQCSSKQFCFSPPPVLLATLFLFASPGTPPANTFSQTIELPNLPTIAHRHC